LAQIVPIAFIPLGVEMYPTIPTQTIAGHSITVTGSITYLFSFLGPGLILSLTI